MVKCIVFVVDDLNTNNQSAQIPSGLPGVGPLGQTARAVGASGH